MNKYYLLSVFPSLCLTLSCVLASDNALADESLLAKIKGAETLPEGAWELDQTMVERADKGAGSYRALNTQTEIEYGVSDHLTLDGSVKMQSINTSGLRIDGYLPGAEKYNLKVSGVEASAKYNFLSPALDDFGLSGYVSLSRDWLDMHSGKDKDKTSLELKLLAQKYFMDGQLIWMGNLGMETTYAVRGKLDNLPADFEWPLKPEMEIGLLAGTGVSYRFAENLFIGAETIVETEFETEVGQERCSLFAGPTIHYGGPRWWASLSWLQQVSGGGEQFDEQDNKGLHLIEKTKSELLVKFGLNF
jgi:hypothetical protein